MVKEMWAFVTLATLIALLAGCFSFEVGIVVAMCAAAWCLLSSASSHAAKDPARSCPNKPAFQSARLANTATPGSGHTSRPRGEGGGGSEASKTRRRPVVREPIVQRLPMEAMLAEHPSEGVLEDCLLQQQMKRSQTLDAHHYHSKALPNAIRSAARELTTADPAIVPLDGTENVCMRTLGHV